MASRANKFIDSCLRTWLPLFIAGSATWDLVQVVRNPTVTTKAPSGTGGAPDGLHGTVQSVAVKLADPSFMDRFVACLPSLLNFVLILSAYGYFAWYKRSHTYNEKASNRLLVVLAVAGGCCMLAPTFFLVVVKYYFDVEVPQYQSGGTSTLLVAAFVLLLVGAIGNRVDWMKEHQRAEKLDSELQDVV